MLKEQGWTDIGMSEEKCGSKAGATTCHSNSKTKESRIDYIFTNQAMTPAVEEAEVDNTSGYPTHRPFAIKVNIKKISKQTKRLRKPTNFAELFEEKVQRKVSEAKAKAEPEKDGDGANQKGKDANENEVRREMLQELRKLMDAAIGRRKAMLHLAAHNRNTVMQWDLITAAVEQANIEFHGLKGKEAKKMRGRSKVEFMKEETGLTRELQEGE